MQTPVEMDVMNKSPVGQDESKKSEKLKMLDITRDKPIKVAVKVAVPVKDHPKFNFVGKLLGPKGNSMKRLQEDTMCKMAVLGRGSMRDRKKEEELRGSGEAKYAHLFEDLHVEISTFAAPAEAHARIAYALAEVRRFLVPDYHDDIRQEQMWEMQALTSTPTTNNMTGDQNSPTNSVDMDITTDDKNPVSPNHRNSNSCSPTTQINSSDNESNILKQHHQQQLHHHDDMDLTTDNKLTDTSQIISTSTASLIPTHITQSQSILSANPSKPTFPAIQHHLTNLLKPTSGLSSAQQTTTGCLSLPIQNDNDTAQPALTLIENPMMHPALRGVKTINIAGNMGRKRPLLGVPRSGMNPTKRTVMTLLARAKHSQSLHPNRNGSTGFAEFLNAPLQMLATSPYILPPQPMDEALMALSKESITQGV